MAIFALTTDHGPRWDVSRGIREQDTWDEHASFMDGLVNDGFLLLGGPLGDGEHTLHMVEAADQHEVAARMGEDPWASMGLLRIGALERWSIWLGRQASQGLTAFRPFSRRFGHSGLPFFGKELLQASEADPPAGAPRPVRGQADLPPGAAPSVDPAERHGTGHRLGLCGRPGDRQRLR